MQHRKYMEACISILVVSLIMFLSACLPRQGSSLIVHTHPASGEVLSAYGWVGISFSQPFQAETVGAAFSILPEVEGETFWQGSTFWFRPITAFEGERSYQARLSGDLRTTDGQTVTVNETWTFTIRQPEMIYYVPQGEGGEIWRAASDGAQAQPLSNTGGRVMDFSVDRSGNRIAFTVQNEVGGQDVWVMERSGVDQRLLVDCWQDPCGEPAWSMDRSAIAYTRQVDLTAQVWTVDVESGETAPLFSHKPAYGFSPAYSPDGRKLAYYDTTAQAITIMDLQTSEEKVVQRAMSGSGDWSPDGSQIIFTDLVPAHHEHFVDAYVYDLASQTVKPAFGESTGDTEFSQPRWHPNGNWAAVSLRPVNAAISKALWVLPLIKRDPILIDDNQSATFSAYQWDPWGESLLYQRYDLGGSEPRASIWRWDWRTRQRTLLIENGARPQWLP